MTAGIVLGALAGSWLDRKLGISPVCLVGLSLTGLVLGALQIARGLNKQSDDPPESPPP
jgi:F0F1-type ATP synthase assembly protein I